MNDSLLDELEKADHHDVYDPDAAYRPLLEAHEEEVRDAPTAAALKNRTRSVEDAEALWAELHSQPRQEAASRTSPGRSFKFNSLPSSNIRPPTYHPPGAPPQFQSSRGGVSSPRDLDMPSPRQGLPTLRSAPATVDVRRHMNLPSLADIKHNWLLNPSTRGRHVPDDAGNVENVDAFLTALYNYYYHNGVSCYIAKEIVQLLNLLFTVCLSSFLLGCIQWTELAHCATAAPAGCKRHVSDFVSWEFEGHLFSTVVLFYFVLFFAFWVTRALAFVSNARDAVDMDVFYREKLRIDGRQVQTMTWDEVVDRVLALLPPSPDRKAPLTPLAHRSSYQLQVDPLHMSTPLDLARRILRKENYMIAFMNSATFQAASSTWMTRLTSHVIFSRNMEFNLQLCLLDPMFDAATATLNPLSPEMLKKHLFAVGMLNLLLTPFLLIFRILQTFLRSMHELRAKDNYQTSRRWSPSALWTFREYNELPHVFDARVERAYPLAETYLGLFPTGVVSIVAGGVAFFMGSIIAVLLLLGLVEESILLEVEFGPFKLLWYLTVASMMFALARRLQASPRFTSGASCEEAMTALAAETHHFPSAWRGQSHTFATRDALLELVPFREWLFLEEILSVLLTPYVLCVALPDKAHEIVRFVDDHTVTLPHVGAVCRFSEFDFKAYGAEPKMESSFMNFKRNHPSWMGPSEGEALVDQVSRFRDEELERSLRMGDTLLPQSPSVNAATLSRTILGDSMFHSQLSMSHQLMQSTAIHRAINQGPAASEYYWLQKYHGRGAIVHDEETKEDMEESLSV
ncbi:Aste57867_9214 [Aphanomyces stellatus]|uniref:Autophagy-related protein 9 n=1 Tax=Aphanomyces stellatus TaxID=120398 RepID=A0A485KME0_9STRA|nr:hypothetical protein As57867_009178 [Aphanomyces stellatus]VFT86097.1 Aste57867_9214 [Aphanomyces stellatus]